MPHCKVRRDIIVSPNSQAYTHLTTTGMFVALATLILAAVSQSAHCTPATSPMKPTKSDVTIAAGFPIRTLDITRNGTVKGTHGGTIGAANPATILLCPEINCAPTCNEFSLNSLAEDECFETNVQARSVVID